MDNSYDFVATQVGLLQSKSVAERTAQDLNLGNNPHPSRPRPTPRAASRLLR